MYTSILIPNQIINFLTMKNPICNTVFDSRDLIEYREELAEELIYRYNDYRSEIDEETEEIDDIKDVDFNNEGFGERYEEEIEHYEQICKFCEELTGSTAFKYGISIIHSRYFENYCRELCEEVGVIPKNFPTWIQIDWAATSENIKHDYYSASFEGSDYYASW